MAWGLPFIDIITFSGLVSVTPEQVGSNAGSAICIHPEPGTCPGAVPLTLPHLP
jgi:hypothetical protein